MCIGFQIISRKLYFYARVAPAVLAAGQTANRGAGRGKGRGAPVGRGRQGVAGCGEAGEAPYNSYDDNDVSNPLPPFAPLRPPGGHFGCPLLRNTMTRAVEFFFPIFYNRNDR